jgi:hypothetical protein
MAASRITTLAVSAVALVALTAAGPANQPNQAGPQTNQVGPWTDANPPPSSGDPYAFARAMNAPQLFGFAGLSNKSGGLGEPDCTGRSAETKSRPKVVATFPASGSVVRPGVVVVRVTFDQPMACDASFAGESDLPNPCGSRWREVTISEDRRSFRAVCEVKANTRYRLTLHNFRNSHGLAIPAEVTFATSGSAPIANIQQALAEDVGGPGIAGG